MNDLTEALREQRNTKGAIEYEALQKFNKLMNKIPIPQPTPMQPTTIRRVTFDPTAKPAPETPPTPRVSIETPAPRVQEVTPIARVQEATPTLRVQPTTPTITAATIDKPLQQNARKTTKKIPTPTQTKLRDKINDARYLRSRLAMRTYIQLRPQDQQQWRDECIQLVRDEETGEYLNYRQLMRHPKHKIIWNTSTANKFGQLAQGIRGKESRVIPTNTIFFITHDQVPIDRQKDVTYGSFSCDLKPNKKETHQTRLTADRDKINYPDDVETPTVDVTLVKTLFNRVILTKGAKCVMLDIKDFYLNTPMARYEYMRLKLTKIPEEIIIEYKLGEIVTADGYVYCEIRKGMYGLPQAGIIFTATLRRTPCKIGIPSEQNCTWTMDTRDKRQKLHVSNGQFRDQIHQKGRRATPHQCNPKG